MGSKCYSQESKKTPVVTKAYQQVFERGPGLELFQRIVKIESYSIDIYAVLPAYGIVSA